MRITINLESDLYLDAKSMAMAEGCSISAAINKLLRRAVEPQPKAKSNNRKFPVSRGKRRFTSEDVYRIEQS